MRNLYVRFGIASLLPFLLLGVALSDAARTSIERRAAEVYGDSARTMFSLMGDSLLIPSDFSAAIPKDRLAFLDSIISKAGPKESVRIRILTTDGITRYSTDASEVGGRPPRPTPFSKAVAGERVTRFTNGGTDSILRNGTKQVEIFLPVRLQGEDDVVGVIEAAGIADGLTTAIEADVRRLQGTLALGLLALWLSLMPILVSVSRRLRRQAEENLHLAMHDGLTGLPNRSLLDQRLREATHAAARTGSLVGLLLIDLDRFKLVNDTLGHRAGDELLQHVATRLRAIVRAEDLVTRLGGDEFAIVVTHRDGLVEDMAEVAERLTDAFAEPFTIGGMDVAVGASIGIVSYPLHGQTPDELFQRADIAMYAAKDADLPFLIYSAEIDSHSPSRLSLAADLRRALRDDTGEIAVYFQPQVSTATGAPEVMEALVRWRHPRRGMLSPAEFVPVAENSGLIRQLTAKVLDSAIAEARTWLDHGAKLAVAVNLSPRDLRDSQLFDVVQGALRRHDLPASQLELEVTESGVLSNPEVAVDILARLHELGVVIALDDFGTGYSSLTYLKRLRPDRLKIDRSFVATMLDQHTDASIVESVIDLAHRLRMGVTAEGVETEMQFRHLSTLACDLAQGYLIARPLPAGDVLPWLQVQALGAAVGDPGLG